MAKEKERKTARILFVQQNKTQSEISKLLGVTEKTISAWCNRYDWRKERTARNASPVRRKNNIKAIITNLSEERLELDAKVKQLEKEGGQDEANTTRERISKIDDAVAKWNKTLMTIDKETEVTLSTYISVLEQIFNDMRLYDPKMFMGTIEFQEQHLHKVTAQLG